MHRVEMLNVGTRWMRCWICTRWNCWVWVPCVSVGCVPGGMLSMYQWRCCICRCFTYLLDLCVLKLCLSHFTSPLTGVFFLPHLFVSVFCWGIFIIPRSWMVWYEVWWSELIVCICICKYCRCVQVCGRSVGIVHLFWVLIVEGSGCFVRYCGVLVVQG